jgi:hypothetical protein
LNPQTRSRRARGHRATHRRRTAGAAPASALERAPPSAPTRRSSGASVPGEPRVMPVHRPTGHSYRLGRAKPPGPERPQIRRDGTAADAAPDGPGLAVSTPRGRLALGRHRDRPADRPQTVKDVLCQAGVVAAPVIRLVAVRWGRGPEGPGMVTRTCCCRPVCRAGWYGVWVCQQRQVIGLQARPRVRRARRWLCPRARAWA